MDKDLLKKIVKRFLSSLFILFLIISFIFILLRISPGDPVQKYVSPDLSPELANLIRESFNLNDSLINQYFTFLQNIIQGNFGISYDYMEPVVTVIFDYLPFTLIFASISFILQATAAISLSVYTFKNKNKFLDKFLSKISLAVYSTPSFVLAVILIYIFSLKLSLFPTSNLRSVDFDEMNVAGKLFDYFKHLFLPLVTLSLAGFVVFYKYIRENLELTARKNFVLYLKAQGLSQKEIIKKHILPNALGPLISIAGIELGILFSGALITEVIFSLPGMGRLTINAILARDYPLVTGCAFTAGFLMIFANFLADLIKAKLDKRLLEVL